MLFNSFIFFIYLGLVLPVFYLLKGKKSKNIFLLISSYFFYGYWDWRFCILLALSTIIDFILGKIIYKENDTQKRKFLLLLSLTANLGILVFFKYFNFFIDSFQQIAQSVGYSLDFLHLNIILPVGISFYTFQTLSYTLDIYRGRLQPTNNLIDFAVFVSFFPQLVAGPIERAKTLLPQISGVKSPTKTHVKEGIVLIITGLFRKVMIGDTSGRIVDHIFGNIGMYKSIELIAALILFSIQIYADFSGYSHMARGVAKLLGIELMKNFEQPYLSRNITEFWRRWHISLSTWLRDYLYISLGGNRKGNLRTYSNLLLTMLLGGLWHGASWNFVIWGGLHGIYLGIHKFSLRGKKKVNKELDKLRIGDAFNISSTYLLVLFTWLFFRARTWDQIILFFSKVFHWEHSEHARIFGIIVVTYMIATLAIDLIEYKYKSHEFLLKINNKGIIICILFSLLLLSFMYMFQADPLPFVYFQF